MPSTKTKHKSLTVRGSGQVCSSSSMISGASKPNRMWLPLYLTQHQSGDASLAASRAAVRDALLQPGSRSRPLALLFLLDSPRCEAAYRKRRSAPPCGPTHTGPQWRHNNNKEESLLMRAMASLGRTNQQTRSPVSFTYQSVIGWAGYSTITVNPLLSISDCSSSSFITVVHHKGLLKETIQFLSLDSNIIIFYHLISLLAINL